MSSSYNNSISSSSTQSFPLFGAANGANNFDSEETAMPMIQQPNPVPPPPPSPPRRLRNKPGNPSPDAEVIALSPEEIMETHKFTCGVCKKKFKREQNLQLHGRGHNLPFNLRINSDEEARKKVYVCPEPTCVYHDPSRALGDLTGIKKHYARKHCEKKFNCEKCSKWYAVESDYKAHLKVCGTKEYRCDCGTTFSRRDSYNSHRAICDFGQGFYGGASSPLAQTLFGNNSNTGFAPLAAGYNLNRPLSESFGNFVPQSTNPNYGPPNYLMQRPSNQGLMLAQNDQNLMNQHGVMNSNNNNNLFNLGQDNNTMNYDRTRVPSLFNDNPSALLRGFSSSPASSGVALNNFGGSTANGNFQSQMNSLPATRAHQGPSGSSIFDHHFGNNVGCGGGPMGGYGRQQFLDFLGVNGGTVGNVGRGGGPNGPPLDVDMQSPNPNNSFGNV